MDTLPYEMGPETVSKMEQDFSGEVDKKLPETEELASKVRWNLK
jgi:hypothetical protein